jgi:chromosome transmission fidelity protein 4
VAAATSANLLRLYSPAGRQLATLTLPGAPIALAARGHALLAVHAAGPACWEAGAAGGQRLGFAVFDVPRQAAASSGPLPLGRGAALAWAGFTDEGLPAAFDSAGVMRVRTPEWGGAWAPVFEAKAARAGACPRGGVGGGQARVGTGQSKRLRLEPIRATLLKPTPTPQPAMPLLPP